MRKTYLRNSRSQTTLTSIHKPPTCLATPFNVQGVKWEIHKHAPDINQPSCPHMHAIGKPWKLDLYTGIIIDCNTGIIIGMIKPRELLAIWRAKGVLKIIIAERALYEELHQKDPIRYPELPPLLINPSETQKTKTKKLRYRRNTTTIQKSDSIIVELTSRQPLEKIRGHCYYSKSRNRSKKKL